ncbi:hypothetical protein DCC85_07365 [Paenibacillus sp. CAA11]|uniref:YheC/YheD family endospore coat-associated protein n=1 Tax=Paenibacillus sp. CAA11 TaxID=1532905 RepID=UPI000D38ACC4|nr:YheC/YheD family protein [Paenibacillus sp. CAA11]AWB44050.1 hypothetical protein DCC85_07365 [Paenibacillus sp. CAA11]
MILKRKGTLGILETEAAGGPHPFAEASFVRKLCLAGEERGIQVFVFCPSDIQDGGDQVHGYTYEKGGWKRRSFPPPDVLYDRYLALGTRQLLQKRKQLAELEKRHSIRYLTRGLAGKWTVYRTLKQFSALLPYLPATLQYKSPRQLANVLDLWKGEAFLKPQNGLHGKLTLHAILSNSAPGTLEVTGRDRSNKVFQHRFSDIEEGFTFIDRFTDNRAFLIQPFLKLTTRSKEPFDVRALVQKGNGGTWSLTGLAVRLGKPGTLTSNLHGGGDARQALPFLESELGAEGGREALAKITRLSRLIPHVLESRFGRMAELGVDFGIEPSGDIWILEVNSKPGRSAFSRIGEPQSARRAIESPLDYAKFLMRQCGSLPLVARSSCIDVL